jgi:hypothetical protein
MASEAKAGLELTAGTSTCPICKRKWVVRPLDDCLLPSCGCFGSDMSANNPNRPCQRCGMEHFSACRIIKMAQGILANSVLRKYGQNDR